MESERGYGYYMATRLENKEFVVALPISYTPSNDIFLVEFGTQGFV